jgi:AcrR family transcriptional regulator
MTKSKRHMPNNLSRNYVNTHELLIKKAGELISKKGSAAFSISDLARVTGITRTSIYYHFDSRQELISQAEKWSSEQEAKRADRRDLCRIDIEHVSSFALRNPAAIKLWIQDYIGAGNIRQRYPQWDGLVARMAEAFVELQPDEHLGAGVYCAVMLTSAFIAPSLVQNWECPPNILERIEHRLARD